MGSFNLNSNTLGKMSKKVKGDGNFIERIEMNAAKKVKGNLGDNHLDSGATTFYQPNGNQTSAPRLNSIRKATDM